MEQYARYKRSRDAAWQTLIDFGITSLPVRVSSICSRLGISLTSYQNAETLLRECGLWQETLQHSGFSVLVNWRWHIFYDDATVASGRARFTVAHELGHILLGHVTQPVGLAVVFRSHQNIGDFDPKQRDPDEQAADMFAARLLAPVCVLREIGAFTPEQIARVCGISITAATIRAKRLAVLCERNAFFSSPLERRVYEGFLDYIHGNT